MPAVRLLLFREWDGTVPFQVWLNKLGRRPRQRCLVVLGNLVQLGHDLRRPMAENLGRGIYELRTRTDGVNYRILYFLHGRDAVVLSHGFKKQQAKIPAREIATALQRKAAFEADPEQHTAFLE